MRDLARIFSEFYYSKYNLWSVDQTKGDVYEFDQKAFLCLNGGRIGGDS